MISFTGNVGMLLDIYRGLGARAEISFSARPSWWTPGSGNAWIGGGLGLDYSHRLDDFFRINFAAGAHYAPFGYQNPRGISVAKHPISGFVYYQQLGLQLGSIVTLGVRVQELPGRDTIIAASVYWEVVAF